MRNLLLLAILLPLLASCKKDAELVPEGRPFVREFFVEGTLKDSDGFNKPFDVTVGAIIEEPFDNRYDNRSMSSLDIRKKIESAFYGLSNSDPGFSFLFERADFAPPGATQYWSKEELEAFFAPGKVFNTDGTPGNVQIKYQVPVPVFLGLQAYANSDGGGSLTITALEDYTFQALTFAGTTITYRGKKVSCTFNTSLQRPIDVAGPGMFQYAPARIENGKATFFVLYQ